MSDEYTIWEFKDVCPHNLFPEDHCDTCCFDIGDAERSMRFDGPVSDWEPEEIGGWENEGGK